jgi:hypothetical protein
MVGPPLWFLSSERTSEGVLNLALMTVDCGSQQTQRGIIAGEQPDGLQFKTASTVKNRQDEKPFSTPMSDSVHRDNSHARALRNCRLFRVVISKQGLRDAFTQQEMTL